MNGLNPSVLPEMLRVAATCAAEITLRLEKGDDPRLADCLNPESSEEMELALLPFQRFLEDKGIPHKNSPELTATTNRFLDQWRELTKAAGRFLPTGERQAFAATVKSAADALVDALAGKNDAKTNKRRFSNLITRLSTSASAAASGIETQITRCKVRDETLAELYQERASEEKNGKYPAIPKGHYAHAIIGKCDRNTGLVEVLNVGVFYISPANEKAWKITARLTESTDERGYEHLGDRTWRSYFSSGKSAKVPREYAASGVKSSGEFIKFIRTSGKRDGFYRLELPD